MRILIVVATSALIAGCSNEADVSVTNASPEQVAREVAASGSGTLGLKPGRWESKVELVSVDAPGMPPEALAAMRDAFATTPSTASCLTPEEAKKPGADFFTAGKGEDCRYERFNLGGGKLDSVLQCGGQGGTGMSMSMQGSYTADTFAMTMTNRTAMPAMGTGKAGAMTMSMKVDARRTGDCTGSERA